MLLLLLLHATVQLSIGQAGSVLLKRPPNEMVDWVLPIHRSFNGDYRLVMGSAELPPRFYTHSGSGSTSLFYWSAWHLDQGSGEWRGEFVSPILESIVRRIYVGRFLEEGTQILVVLDSGVVQFYDEQSYRLLFERDYGSSQVRLADLEQDGDMELVVGDRETLRAYDRDGLLWQIGGYDGRGFLVSQQSPDTELEIVLTDRVLSGGSGNVEWSYPPLGSRSYLAASGDVNRDGLDEVLVAHPTAQGELLDLRTGTSLWSALVGAVGSKIVDFDRDGQVELVTPWGSGVAVVDVADGHQLWEWQPEHASSSRVEVGDYDRDGRMEVAFGTRGPTGRLVLGEWRGANRWLSPPLFSGTLGPRVGDLDGDGENELVVATRYQSSSGVVLVLDATTSQLLAVSPQLHEFGAYAAPDDVELRDLDGDGADEILVGGGKSGGWGGVALALRYREGSFDEVWTSPKLVPTAGYQIRAVEAADVDGDGAVEVLLGGSLDSSGIPGLVVVALDAASGSEKWRTERLPSPTLASFPARITELRVADIDGDREPEIVTILYRRGLHVIDGRDGALEGTLGGDLRSLAVVPLAGVDRPALAVGTADSLRLFLHDGNRLAEIARLDLQGPVTAITPSARRGALWVHAAGKLRYVRLFRRRLLELWATEDYALDDGSFLSCGGRRELLTGGQLGLFAFRVPRWLSARECRRGLVGFEPN